MAKKVDAWLADDGSLHTTEAEARKHEKQRELEGIAQDLSVQLATSSTKIMELKQNIITEWDYICDNVLEYLGMK